LDPCVWFLVPPIVVEDGLEVDEFVRFLLLVEALVGRMNPLLFTCVLVVSRWETERLEISPGRKPTNITPKMTAKIAYIPILIEINYTSLSASLNARVPNSCSNVRTTQRGFSLQIFMVSYQNMAAGIRPIMRVVTYSRVGSNGNWNRKVTSIEVMRTA